VGYVGCIGIGEMHKIFWTEYLKVKDHLGNLGLDGRIILKLISRNRLEDMDLIHWFGIETGGRLL
jgi:hypothetical protein